MRPLGFGVMKGTFTLGMPKGQEELAEQPFAGLGTKESPKGFTIGGQTAYITGKFAAKLTAARNGATPALKKKKKKKKNQNQRPGTGRQSADGILETS